jgi:hypothetical protein
VYLLFGLASTGGIALPHFSCDALYSVGAVCSCSEAEGDSNLSVCGIGCLGQELAGEGFWREIRSPSCLVLELEVHLA